jgi:hypothetical protein
MPASPEAIATVAKVLALGLTTPELAKAYLGGDGEALELATALAEREPGSLADADAAKLTSVARNLLRLGLSDRDVLADALADHPQGDAIKETALALAGMSAHRAPEPEPLSPLEAAHRTPARHRTPEERQLVADADARIMEAAALAAGIKWNPVTKHPISPAHCVAGLHHWGPKDRRGFRQCEACEVWSVVDHDHPGPIDPHAHDHAADATVHTYETGRIFNSRNA